ncbi:hypothetical protein V8G54_034176, partial [Vigna mungo]
EVCKKCRRGSQSFFHIQEQGKLRFLSSSRQPSASAPNRINAAPPDRSSMSLATMPTLEASSPFTALLLWLALFHTWERNSANARHRSSLLLVPMLLVVATTKTDDVAGVVNVILFLRWVSSILFKLCNTHQE